MKEKNILIMLGAVLAAIIILGVIFIAALNQSITEVKTEIMNSQSTIFSQISSINGTVSNMMQNIQAMLNKQDSLIADYSITYGKPNADTLMCDVLVSVTPKTFSANTTAELFIGDKIATMSQDGNSYTATIPYPITASGNVTVTFQQDGISQTEVLPEAVDIGSMLANGLTVEQPGWWSFENNTLHFEGNVLVSFYSILPDTVESAHFVAVESGEEIWRQEIDQPIQNNQEYLNAQEIPFNQTFSNVPDDESLSVYVEVICGSGFTYRRALMANKDTDMSGVYDADGNKIIFNHEASSDY